MQYYYFAELRYRFLVDFTVVRRSRGRQRLGKSIRRRCERKLSHWQRSRTRTFILRRKKNTGSISRINQQGRVFVATRCSVQRGTVICDVCTFVMSHLSVRRSRAFYHRCERRKYEINARAMFRLARKRAIRSGLARSLRRSMTIIDIAIDRLCNRTGNRAVVDVALRDVSTIRLPSQQCGWQVSS